MTDSRSFELRTNRLLLEPFTTSDAGFLFEHWTSPDVRRYLWDDKVIARETVDETIAASIRSFFHAGFGFWLVRVQSSHEAVGFAGLRPFGDDGEIELMYGLSVDHWGQGYATESAEAVLSFGLDQAGLARVHAGTDPPNAASIRVLERLGMQFEGERVIGGLPARYYVLERSDRSIRRQ